MHKVTSMKKRFDGLLPVVVDLETGGVNYQKDALLEVAAITLRMDENGLIGKKDLYHAHVMPFEGANINPRALEINQIDPFHPFRFAKPEHEALTELFAFIEKEVKAQDCRRAVLVAHNAHFDLYFLEAAVKRCKLKSPFHAFTCFDTATLCGLGFGKTVLAKAAKVAGIRFDKEKAHSAIYDTEVAVELFCQVVNKMTFDSRQSSPMDSSNNTKATTENA